MTKNTNSKEVRDKIVINQSENSERQTNSLLHLQNESISNTELEIGITIVITTSREL